MRAYEFDRGRNGVSAYAWLLARGVEGVLNQQIHRRTESLGAPHGAAFSGEVKLVRKATGYEKSLRPTGSGFAGEASFPAPFDRISDPQIPLTRLIFGLALLHM